MNVLLLFVFISCAAIICSASDDATKSDEITQTEGDPIVDHTHDNYDEFTQTTTTASVATTTEEPYFSEMPEGIQIVYIEAETLLKYDNKGEVVMGAGNEKCDNGQVCATSDS